MTRTDRRTALQLAMAAALTPIFGQGPALAAPVRLIVPAIDPMRYRRTVSRALVDGKQFTVTRDFIVRFRQVAEGFVIDGTQQSVSVDAPPQLASFARLEENRDESALFPLMLDPFGQITGATSAVSFDQDIRHAVRDALAALEQFPLPADEHEQLSRYLSALQAASQRVTAHLPADLFAPAETLRHDEQAIALPGGIEGQVTTCFEGVRDNQTGLMREADREVVTTVANNSRSTREHWSLRPL